ncbi:MAG: hydrolase [Verrucomicrobia bacterium]|nr:MAG: hydrolase [Verrucomicrobiota bacterium]
MSNAATKHLADIRHLALDMDGTIYSGGTLFPWTRPFLNRMTEMGIGYTFLTNNSSKSARDYLAKLEALDLGVEADQLFTSGLCMIEYLRSHRPDFKRLYILGTGSLRDEFSERGFTVVGNSADDAPDALIVAFDTALDYDDLCMAAYWAEQGKPYLATHPDKICPTDLKTVLVDCGAICDCIESATGRKPDLVLGKPHASMLDGILAKHQLEPHQLGMVGDRLYTDIAMAEASGTFGVLVLSGEATAADVAACPIPPDLVVPDIGELGQCLQNAAGNAVRTGR